MLAINGGSDPGAVGNDLLEKHINLGIMLSCREELARHGVSVTCSRTADEDDPVQEEVREANASGADVALSIHTNAGGGDGSESYYCAGYSDGRRLAELCEKHVKEIGQNSRGVKTADLCFTRETAMTAVLCECAFIDNANDISIVDTAAEQKAFGTAYARAILEYLGIAYRAPAEPPGPGGKLYRVQVGAFAVRANAERLERELEGKGYDAFIV